MVNLLSSKVGFHVSFSSFSVQLIWSLQCLVVRGPMLQMGVCNQFQTCWTNVLQIFMTNVFDDCHSSELLCACVFYSFLAPLPRLKILILSLPFSITFFSPPKSNWISWALFQLHFCSIFSAHFQYPLRTVYSGGFLSIIIWDGFLGNNNQP